MEIFTQMDLTLLAVIIVLLVLAAVVIGAGTLTYALQAWRSKRESRAASPGRGQREESQHLATETASATPAQERTVLRSEDEMPARPGEVMRVLRDESSGALVVEVEGQRYRRLTEIRDGRVGRRVLWAIADLLRFAEEVPLETVARTMSAAATPSPAPQPEVAPIAPPTPASEVSVKAPPEVEEEFLRRLKEGELAAEEREPSKPAGGGFRRRKAAKPSSKPAAPRTFVDEIEDILQEFIRESVVPVDKPAHVHTGPDGALEIDVDGRIYERPDDVPDPIVRGLIKAAVEEWERR
ncbi:MAG: hypothetical protein NUW24_10315 [Anaerolineae bacterium]|jgi:hypothetical protein|nr:hypothetical protein [Anaerolineae bacterium]MDH7474035.1 hypothetical protein [Anaerolineae bacterium]